MISGYVYLIGTPLFGWYKIGKSRTPTVRVSDLGILLPFKIKVLGVWKAQDHTKLEAELHQQYKQNRINGEWFSFTREEVAHLYISLPSAARVYPNGSLDSVFSTFSNVEEDRCKGRRVLGVRTEKLRGNFTLEERKEKRKAAIAEQKRKRAIKLSQMSLQIS